MFPPPLRRLSLSFGAPFPGRPVDCPHKFLDKHAVEHLVNGYADGVFIDRLIQDLEDQGYDSPPYVEAIYHLIINKLVPSADRALLEESKPLIEDAIAEVTQDINTDPEAYYDYQEFELEREHDPAREQAFADFLAKSGLHIPEHRPDLVQKPFNRDAAVIFVTKFRAGFSIYKILEELDELKYRFPTSDETDRLLEANRLARDEHLLDYERQELYKDRAWSEIRIPDSVFEER
ncbi:hypothetical protein MMC30_000035 [Trapelia coarctata]|nr:hypothetical protein [Trapelia coarctata]